MFDTVTGLPVHALVVHAVLVLVPAAAAGVVAIAAVPRWRERYGTLVLLVATSGLVLVPVATQSGTELRDRLDAGGVVAKQIKEHADAGELLIWPTLTMWVLAVALVLMSRRRSSGGGALKVVAVLAILASLAAGAAVVRVGHLGTKAVWSCTIDSSDC